MADQPTNNRFEFDRLRLELSKGDEEKDKLSAEFLKKQQGEDAGGVKPKITDVDANPEEAVAEPVAQPASEEASEDMPAPAPAEPKRSFWSRMLSSSPEAKKKQQDQRRSDDAKALVQRLETDRLEQERVAEAASLAIMSKAGNVHDVPPPVPVSKPASSLFEKTEPQEQPDFGLNKPRPATTQEDGPEAIQSASGGIPDPITRDKEASTQSANIDMGMGGRISFADDSVSDSRDGKKGDDEEERQKQKEEERKKEYRRQSEEAFEALQKQHKERQDGFEAARNQKKAEKAEATAIEMEKQAVERKEWAREATERELVKKDIEAVDAFRTEGAERERINLQAQETRDAESRREFEQNSSSQPASGSWVSSLFPMSFSSGGSGGGNNDQDHYAQDRDAYPSVEPLPDPRDSYPAQDNRGVDAGQGGGSGGSWVSGLFGGRNDDALDNHSSPANYASQMDDRGQAERERREFDERRAADTQRPFVSTLFGPRDEPPAYSPPGNSYDALPLPASNSYNDTSSQSSSSSGSSSSFGSLFGFSGSGGSSGGDDRYVPPPLPDDYLNVQNTIPTREYVSNDTYSSGGSSGSDWQAQQAQQDTARRESENAARESQRAEAERMRTEMEQFRSQREDASSHHNSHNSHQSHNNSYNNYNGGNNNNNHHSELPSHYRPPDPPPYGS